VMEQKLTNSGPLREPADKHSIYAIKILQFQYPFVLGVTRRVQSKSEQHS
jgi:hypothetical protein